MKFTTFASISLGLALSGCAVAPEEADPSRVGQQESTSGSADMPVTVPAPEGEEAGTPEIDPDAGLPGEGCGADEVTSFLSREATPQVRRAVVAKVGHDRIRWLDPDSVVTMDLQADRLNMMLDEDGVITGAKCQ